MWSELKLLWNAHRQQLDTMIEQWAAGYARQGGRLFCAAGCSGCCTLFVQATLIDAMMIASCLDEGQLVALQRYVERQREAVRGIHDLKTCLQRHRQVIGPCPFLDENGRCGIYTVRPYACRALLSTRPAEWCAIDFAELTPLDRQLYLAALDRNVVAYPIHYVAATQDHALQLEEQLLQEMQRRFGLSIRGNLPLLVLLEREAGLSRAVTAGAAAVHNVLDSHGPISPLLLVIGQDNHG